MTITKLAALVVALALFLSAADALGAESEEVARLRAENAMLRSVDEKRREKIDKLEAANESLQEEVERLRQACRDAGIPVDEEAGGDKDLAPDTEEAEANAGQFAPALSNRSRNGRRAAAAAYGVPKGTDESVLEGLRWLKRAQEENGSWSCAKWGGGAGADAGVTGLALLAFLGCGCTDKTPEEFAPTVRKAVQYLIVRQKEVGGEPGPNKGGFGEQLYSQGICTTALAEAHGMEIGGAGVRQAAQDGLDYILRRQPDGGGFSYTGPGNDTSVTGFQMQAIKAGISCGLKVPKEARQKAEAFLTMCLNPEGSTNYVAGSPGGSVPMTAAALTARLFLGHKRNAPDCVAQAKWLVDNNHLEFAKNVTNLYGIYYLSLSMFNMQGNLWKQWNAAYNQPLRAKQEKAGPESGSWPHTGATWGGNGGRVYTTAMAILALEACFPYVPHE